MAPPKPISFPPAGVRMCRFLSRFTLLLAMLCMVPALVLLPCQAARAEEHASIREALGKLAWQRGPTQGAIAGKGTITVPAGYAFLDEQNTQHFLELMGNPPSAGNYLLAPETLQWFAVFSFDETGFIKDDEKIDPDDLLKKLKDGDAATNEERKKRGFPAIHTDGWMVPPHYDADTRRLEWGVRLRNDSNEVNVNYTSRILGRSGVMRAILVDDTETLHADLKPFKAALQDFHYNPGETYAEFRQGDRIAEYGLAALVLGGAAAVATKKGLWSVLAGALAAFWKVIVGVVLALAASVKKFFRKDLP